jgi:hypothetical protein
MGSRMVVASRRSDEGDVPEERDRDNEDQVESEY